MKYTYAYGYAKYLSKKFFPVSAVLFLILTLIYIGLEVFFNFKLIDLMSVETTKDKLDKFEIYGKILSGIGIGLIITKKYIDRCIHDSSEILLQFATWSIVGIIISFALQTAIIKTVVYLGSDEDKAKALLIAQLNNTHIPFYAKPENNDNFDLTPHEYFTASQECRDLGKGVKLEDDSKLNKVFFAFQTLNQKFDEDKYQKIINDYQKCLIPKTILENLPKPHLDDKVLTRVEVRNELYSKYTEINTTYQDKVNQFKEAKRNNRIPFGQGSGIVRKIQTEWINASKSMFGQDSTVSPNLSRSQFNNHKDVIKKVDSLPNRESLQKAYKEQRKNVYESSLENVLAPYTAHRQFIDEVREKNDYSSPLIGEGYAHKADQAYKSIVMPIIILFFSILFLMLNILSLFTFFVNRIETRFTERRTFTKLSNYLVIGVLVWLISLPIFSKQPVLENADKFTTVVYFYEKLLIDLYEKRDAKEAIKTITQEINKE